MKTSSKFLGIITISSLVVACNSNAPTEAIETKEAEEVTPTEVTAVSYEVVTEGDEVNWEGYETFSGDNHYGTVQVTEGAFEVEEGTIVGGNFTIDMNSINSMDLAEKPEMKGKLEGHLKSPDFFAVDSFPNAMFEVTAVKVAENDTTGATHHIDGNLTLRGITKNITIPAMVNMENGMIGFATPEFVIDRSQWNVRFRSTSFAEFANVAKDKAIDNNIKLKIDLKAKKA
jgi:polyisoprenoid-binding protein YceI